MSVVAPSTRTFLLLGGTGFIGANLAAALSHAGHDVIVTGRTAHGPNHASSVAVPLADTAMILNLIEARGIDTVIHLASSMLPSSTGAAYLDEQDAIAIPTRRLAAQLAVRGVRLVFFSSGGTVYGEVPRDRAAEDDRCEPIGYYGQSKLETELHLRFLERTRGLNLLTIRPSNPFGMHQSLTGAQGLISVILGKLQNGQPLEVWGDGTAVRDYIYIDDFVTSCRMLIERNTIGATLNVGSGIGHSLLEVVATVEAALGCTVPLIFRPGRPADVPRLVLDIERIKAMGMHRDRPLIDGIRDYATKLGMA